MVQIKSILENSSASDIKTALTSLVAEHRDRNGGFYLSEVAGGYQFRTKPEYKEWATKIHQAAPFRMSKAALETLTIIAYKQPLIRSDIEHIRGVDSGGVIRHLIDLKLIRVAGRKDIPGRPLIYATSKHFLEVFGLNDIRDLPTLKEIDDLEKNPHEPDESVADVEGSEGIYPEEGNKDIRVEDIPESEKALT